MTICDYAGLFIGLGKMCVRWEKILASVEKTQSLFVFFSLSNPLLPPTAADKRHSHGEPVADRRQEADREVKGQVEDGGAAGRAGHAAQHPRPGRQHPVGQQLGQRR